MSCHSLCLLTHVLSFIMFAHACPVIHYVCSPVSCISLCLLTHVLSFIMFAHLCPVFHYVCSHMSCISYMLAHLFFPVAAHVCPLGFYQCVSGHCISEEQRCDRKLDCILDGSDEIGCMYSGDLEVCQDDEFTCDTNVSDSLKNLNLKYKYRTQ